MQLHYCTKFLCRHLWRLHCSVLVCLAPTSRRQHFCWGTAQMFGFMRAQRGHNFSDKSSCETPLTGPVCPQPLSPAPQAVPPDCRCLLPEFVLTTERFSLDPETLHAPCTSMGPYV